MISKVRLTSRSRVFNQTEACANRWAWLIKGMNRKQRIQRRLIAELEPLQLFIEDESQNHNVPEGSESHFKVIIVSEHFEDLKSVQRHQLIYKLLDLEFEQGLHALSLHCFSPTEWEDKSQGLMDSPPCLHKS